MFVLRVALKPKRGGGGGSSTCETKLLRCNLQFRRKVFIFTTSEENFANVELNLGFSEPVATVTDNGAAQGVRRCCIFHRLELTGAITHAATFHIRMRPRPGQETTSPPGKTIHVLEL